MNAAKEILEFPPRSVALATTHPSTQAPKNEPHWDFEETRGRFVELSGAAALTAALALILRAQERREPAAWIGTPESIFYAHDAAAAGVDLDALVVVRVPDATAVPRAADTLARSGAFGILVLDLGGKSDVPVARQSRLSSLAQKHGTALVALTDKSAAWPSLSSLVSLRVEADRAFDASGGPALALTALRDKRRGPGWRREVPADGPPGLR